MVEGTPDYEGVAKQVMRTDLYEEAMKEIGVDARRPRTTTPETLFDGVTFDPDEARRSTRRRFAVNSTEGLNG